MVAGWRVALPVAGTEVNRHIGALSVVAFWCRWITSCQQIAPAFDQAFLALWARIFCARLHHLEPGHGQDHSPP